MRLDVTALPEETGSRMEVPLSVTLAPEDEEEGTVAFPEPFVGTAEAIRTDRGILVRVKAQGEALMECARCLAPVRVPVRVEFAEEFRPGEPLDQPGELAQGGEGEAYVPFAGDAIDLDEVLRQHVLLELPMKPLCREACAGLCPRCGKDLNEGPCACPPDGVDEDHPLGALRRLLDHMPEGPQNGQ